MPKIERLFTLEITPERFVNTCSEDELQELALLVSKRIDSIIRLNEIIMRAKLLGQNPNIYENYQKLLDSSYPSGEQTNP